MAKNRKPKKSKKAKQEEKVQIKLPYNWITKLNEKPNLNAAPVELFKCLNITQSWQNLFNKDIKIEVQHDNLIRINDNLTYNDCYWVAKIIKTSGFFILLRYEGYEDDNTDDFWVHVYDDKIKPCGWVQECGKNLLPPQNLIIRNQKIDWRLCLMKSLINSYTLPKNFKEQIGTCIKSNFEIGLKLEAIDLEKVCALRVATVVNIIGPRIQVAYNPNQQLTNRNSFWCHQQSSLIHPVGWAQMVGHELECSTDYIQQTNLKLQNGDWKENDGSFKYFPHVFRSMKEFHDKHNSNEQKLKKNMRVEAIDALNMNHIRLSTVFKPLRYDYLLIGVDGDMEKDGSDCWCCHKSECLPVGFCKKNKIEFSVPKDYKKRNFDCDQYLKEKGAIAAPEYLFDDEIYDQKHGFKKGMYLEATDLMEPNLICPARVKQVAGRLLKIAFVGWTEDYDQWVDCNSCEIYPIGWCHMAGYYLETPTRQIKSGCEYESEDSSLIEIASVKYAPKKTKNSNKKSNKKQKTGKRIIKYSDSSDSSCESMDLESVTSEIILTTRGRPASKKYNTRNSSSTTSSTKKVQNKNAKKNSKDNSKKSNLRSSLNQSTIRTRSHDRNNKNYSYELSDSENDIIIDEENHNESNSMNNYIGNLDEDFEQIDLDNQLNLNEDENMNDQNNNCFNEIYDQNHQFDGEVLNGDNEDNDDEDNDDEDTDQPDRNPFSWTVNQVTDFLKLNGCDPSISDAFSKNQITGEILMRLEKDDIYNMVKDKLGPALKVVQLIKDLKLAVNILEQENQNSE